MAAAAIQLSNRLQVLNPFVGDQQTSWICLKTPPGASEIRYQSASPVDFNRLPNSVLPVRGVAQL